MVAEIERKLRTRSPAMSAHTTARSWEYSSDLSLSGPSDHRLSLRRAGGKFLAVRAPNLMMLPEIRASVNAARLGSSHFIASGAPDSKAATTEIDGPFENPGRRQSRDPKPASHGPQTCSEGDPLFGRHPS